MSGPTDAPMPRLLDAPPIERDRLTDRQRAGRSCAWCAGSVDGSFPVGDLHACPCCAAMYDVREADR